MTPTQYTCSLVSSSKNEREIIPFGLKCLGPSNKSFKATSNAICNVNPMYIVPIDHNLSIAFFVSPIQKKAQFRSDASNQRSSPVISLYNTMNLGDHLLYDVFQKNPLIGIGTILSIIESYN